MSWLLTLNDVPLPLCPLKNLNAFWRIGKMTLNVNGAVAPPLVSQKRNATELSKAVWKYKDYTTKRHRSFGLLFSMQCLVVQGRDRSKYKLRNLKIFVVKNRDS